MTRLKNLAFATLIATAAMPAFADDQKATSAIVGTLTTYDPSFHEVVAADARIEKIAEGFTWSEGPVWIDSGGYLLFNDVPENTMYRWSEKDGLSVFLKPSGYDGDDLSTLREAGANGLLLEPDGSLLLADSGTRIVARLDLATKTRKPVATSFEGKRFNSPNDVARRRDGAVFFTDPPYGLKGMNESPVKEQPANGVYRVDADGTVHLIDDQLTFPNGVALSPDEHTLYVSNSDPKQPIWVAYALDADGNVVSRRVFDDATDLVAEGKPGLPDGMAMSADGHLFASAPGGILVFDDAGKRLGRIETGVAVSNCAFGDDGRTLYMTSHSFVARVATRATGVDGG
jgi:gluconolactonase